MQIYDDDSNVYYVDGWICGVLNLTKMAFDFMLLKLFTKVELCNSYLQMSQVSNLTCQDSS